MGKGAGSVIVCVPVDSAGDVGRRWGRAARVAIATIEHGSIGDWQEFAVEWDVLHDTGGEGAHHARVARFLRDHRVDVVMAPHMGEGMSRMLKTMGIAVQLGVAGGARGAVLSALPGPSPAAE